MVNTIQYNHIKSSLCHKVPHPPLPKLPPPTRRGPLFLPQTPGLSSLAPGSHPPSWLASGSAHAGLLAPATPASACQQTLTSEVEGREGLDGEIDPKREETKPPKS